MIEDDGNVVVEYIEKYLGCIDSSINEIVPITDSEEVLVRTNGNDAVMHMLKSKDIVDLERDYLV